MVNYVLQCPVGVGRGLLRPPVARSSLAECQEGKANHDTYVVSPTAGMEMLST